MESAGTERGCRLYISSSSKCMPPFHQLTKDKDVVAQYEAVRGMESMSTYKVCSCLFRCLMDVRTFYRVRMECAYAMARGFSLQRLDDVGVKLLFLAYRKKFCASIQPPMPNTLPAFPPKRNDFRTITEYYVQKAIISGLAQSNPDRPILGSIIRNFLLDQLKLNDNTQNQYNDAHYIASLVKAIGSTYVVTQDLKPAIAALPSNFQGPSLNDALVEVERFLFLETQLPTYRNIVASACLSVLLTWMMHGLIPSDVKPFLVFSRPGNFIDVRLMALSGLVVTGLSTLPERSINANAGSVGGTTDDSSSDPRVVAIMDYLIHLIKTDTHYMRFAVVRCISDYVAGLSSIVRKQAEDEEAKAERDRMEKERADLARNAGEEPEVEDLGMGIEQRVDNMRRTESGDVAAVFKHLAEMKAFRIDMWKLFK